MMYPFITLEDNTEIVHSEMLPDNRVKVYVEKPDAKDCFHDMTCYLPSYEIESVNGFSEEKVAEYLEIIRSTAHLIIQLASQGGLGKAALYAHLDQAIDDVKSGRVQEVDEAFDDILSELDRVKI